MRLGTPSSQLFFWRENHDADSDVIVNAAVRALSELGGIPPQDADAEMQAARTVSVAVLSALGGGAGKGGLFPFRSNAAQQLLALADKIEADNGVNGTAAGK